MPGLRSPAGRSPGVLPDLEALRIKAGQESAGTYLQLKHRAAGDPR